MEKRTPAQLAIFDFDGTLTLRDTTFGFVFYFAGTAKAIVSLLAILPYWILAGLGQLKMQTVKEKLFKIIFGGCSIFKVQKCGNSYGANEIPKILHPTVYSEMKKLQSQGFEILILSASCSVWLKSWCEKECLQLICSELEISNNCFTGKLKGQNCYGKEKLKRLYEVYEIDKINEVVAYGNHASDLHYMKLAREAYLVNGKKITAL
ncbi:MAG: HAD-IB family hydrolase [Bacteroidetes bacterium]|nr:HAD-IB family hydrolase [Bacteroidota bacterium]